MPTKPFYLKLPQMLSNCWSVKTHTPDLIFGYPTDAFSLKYTQTIHTHNQMLHSDWHTLPEANPVDRSHRANPLSEQWFPNARKPQNPQRSENNK